MVNSALQFRGSYGHLRDHPIERVLRDVRARQILAREVMRLIISRDVWGEIDQGEVHNCR